MAKRQKPKPHNRTSPNRCHLITNIEMQYQKRNKRRGLPHNPKPGK
jgi:hypothetical protein